MTGPLVYTLALTRGARALCDRLSLTVRHFETEEELIEALAAQVPTGVFIHGTKQDARVLEARLVVLPGSEKVRVLPIGRLDGPAVDDDDDDVGTATAVKTVFDTMPELSDSDPWIKRPM